ncbi:MAG: cell cycle transcriptional regulator TrcR, partial [Pseudomonadota bacterium]
IKELPSQLKKSKKSGKKYTPISKRQDKPDAIHFILKKFPAVTDAQICKLIGTTKNTIASVRDKTHWKSQTMRDVDPVIAGFCTQSELDMAIKRGEARLEREKAAQEALNPAPADNQTLVDPDKFFN